MSCCRRWSQKATFDCDRCNVNVLCQRDLHTYSESVLVASCPKSISMEQLVAYAAKLTSFKLIPLTPHVSFIDSGHGTGLFWYLH